jgi:hypothetical protein
MSKSKIIAFSGYKVSGKSTACEFIYNQYCYQKSIKIYSFADKLKQFCIECLGLSYDQCYGSDEQKNSLTNLYWENMPGVLTPSNAYSLFKLIWDCKTCKDNPIWISPFDTVDNKCPILENYGIIYHKDGQMTAREVLQFFGTQICRRMYSNIWVDACLRQIKTDNVDLALISDLRFPNEFKAIKDNGGIIIRLTRNICKVDLHESELALDKNCFDWKQFDYIIDNQDMTEEEKNSKIAELLNKDEVL